MNKTKKILLEIISALFTILFLYAATSKLLTHDWFIAQIGSTEMLRPYAKILAWLVPLIEILGAITVWVPPLRLAGLLMCTSLMLIFTVYIFSVLNFSAHVPCACGGVLQKMSWTTHLYFNIAFLIVGVVGCKIEMDNRRDSSGSKHSMSYFS